VRRILERLKVDTRRWPAKWVQSAISSAKNQLVDPTAYAVTARDPGSRVVGDAYPLYQQALREQNALDFDDLLVQPVTLFREHPRVLEDYRQRFHYLLVDEYQDTNHAQFRFVELLAREHQNLMVVGDDDQCIYGWRGAEVRNILDFEKSFPAARLIRLEQNYRSTGRILQAANAVISQNLQRKGKTLRTVAAAGEPLTLVASGSEMDEADWIAGEIQQRQARSPGGSLREFAVLYRTNAQSRALEEAMRRRNLPYQVIGGTRFYERREIMDALAYLRLISNPRDAGAFDRIVNVPRRGIGDVSRARILDWAAELQLPILEAAGRAAECPGLNAGAARTLAGFAEKLQRFRSLSTHLGAGELLDQVIEEVGLLDALLQEGPEGKDRVDNVKELIAGAHEFDERRSELDEPEDAGASALDLFLQKVSLIADVDRHDSEANAVTLMTLHHAKGLEFPVVFLSGLEDGLFPLARAYDEPDMLEEERRLFYVGLTRAKRKIYLSHARTRRRAGEVIRCRRSNFVDRIPAELLEERSTAAAASYRSFGEPLGWRDDRSVEAGAWQRRGRSEPAWSDSPTVDLADARDVPRFVKGERVRHPDFGPGTIRELSGFGRDLRAVIEFRDVGVKKLVVRMANLQRET
jgi:DNA helicase-2/ATP-dependent DNA helicase PcrA